ncbi:hypothetical protein NSK_005738 [Nannochloropsis salina CCMP1776]|uniref:Uncharacterized protein n=1 Tax=Nannochloropsis salina CCMP1776 TaxID=1027361 RepID=A0A4D9D035_9STRA|nr:hypothetical protein NSK_005738 [Nannochloropsis salina CCMP1776]|eukprot:TFJ82965.1 hypothetical protein NSK_005738 [Nannochloropsis salina CCMP1776]
MPEGPLYEEHELIWDDRVAAEMCIDFDASFVPTREAFRWWLGGFGFFFGLLGLVALTDPASVNPCVNKAETMPDLGLPFLPTGGSPEGGEEEEGEEEE